MPFPPRLHETQRHYYFPKILTNSKNGLEIWKKLSISF